MKAYKLIPKDMTSKPLNREEIDKHKRDGENVITELATVKMENRTKEFEIKRLIRELAAQKEIIMDLITDWCSDFDGKYFYPTRKAFAIAFDYAVKQGWIKQEQVIR